MFPAKIDDKLILRCRECGYEKPITDSRYKVDYRVKHSPREKIVVVEREAETPDEEITEDERRERRKAILEFYEEEETE